MSSPLIPQGAPEALHGHLETAHAALGAVQEAIEEAAGRVEAGRATAKLSVPDLNEAPAS